MYSYDYSKTASRLKVIESAPVELSYDHPTHGPVRIAYTDARWVAVTENHKIYPLTIRVGPQQIMHPQAQKMLMAQVDEALR